MDDMMSSAEWPELLGMNLQMAKAKILTDRPHVQLLINPGSISACLDRNRVCLHVDDNGLVSKVPKCA